MVFDLIHNIALLVALGVGLQILARRTEGRPAMYGLVTGLLFGCVGVVGMMTPMKFAPGVIYDGRSIVLSLAGLFGGPIAAAISAVMCSVYRYSVGGAGVWAGLATIVESAILGTILFYFRRRDEIWVSPIRLWLFAILVHVIMMAAQFLIPNYGWEVLRRVGPSVLLFYPLAFLLIAQVFLDGERRRIADAALRESEQKYRDLVENANSSILRMDIMGTITFLNEFACRFFGYSRQDLIGQKVPHEILPLRTQAGKNLPEMIHDIAIHPEQYTSNEIENICKDGTRVWIAWANKPILDEHGQCVEILCVGNDITERKRAEEALKESESRWQFALEGARDGVWDWNVQTNKLYFSKRWKEMLGFEEDEIKDSLEEWEKRVHPDDLASCYVELNRHLKGETPFYQDEYRMFCKDGTCKWILDRGKVIQWTAEGVPVRFLGTHTDISDRKQAEAEREKLEGQLLQSQKMEAVGQLAGGVAHDFNNLLQIILGNVDMIIKELGQDLPSGGPLDDVRMAAERAADLTHQLLAFSRRQVIQPVTLDLNDLIQGMLKMIRRLIGEHIDLRFWPEHNLGPVQADRGQIEQIVMNLCVNAHDAMPKGGTLTIVTRSVAIDSNYCDDHPWASEGRYALMSVTDTGIGMDEITRMRVFEPFFTTKSMGHGTGLGLATVYGIVKHHNGFIHVYSEPGKGTEFKIYLPVVDSPLEEVRIMEERGTLNGTETILVAEDEDMVRELAVRLLEDAGYIVHAAYDGEEAVRIFRENANSIDLALLDVMMPRISGREVMERIKAMSPQMRFLFCSGYSENVIHTDFVVEEGVHIITKPYRREGLLRAIREVLDAPPA